MAKDRNVGSDGKAALGRAPRARAVMLIVIVTGFIAWVETHHGIPAFRAWTFGLVFLLAVIATVLARGRMRDGLVAVAALTCGLCILEVAAVFLEHRRDKLDITPGWTVDQPVVGWALGTWGDVHARKTALPSGALIYDATYTIDHALNREVKSAQTGPATVFFGDSMTFGEGLNNADTLPQRFSDLLGGSNASLIWPFQGIARSSSFANFKQDTKVMSSARSPGRLCL